MNNHTVSDRIAGVLVSAACGDALGAGYEFGPSVPAGQPVLMRGQGAFEPGEWTDDTAQLVAVAQAAAQGIDLASDEGLEAAAAGLLDWYYSPARLKDIGLHTSAVMREVATVTGPGLAARFRKTAQAKEDRHPRSSGGNGALMRTAPVALAHLDHPERMVAAAMAVGDLTHADPVSSQACAVWCLAIRAAILRSAQPSDLDAFAADVRSEIEMWLDSDQAITWIAHLDAAEGRDPREFTRGNGYSLTTVQAAWAAITSTKVSADMPGQHLRLALEEAVRGGGDADTVACVAGALLGAMWGLSAVPLQWRRAIHGWPDARDRDLVGLAVNACPRTRSTAGWPGLARQDYSGWPGTDAVAVHPHDANVIIGGVEAATGRVPLPGARVPTAVVSLCRMGSEDLDHLALDAGCGLEVRLIDEPGANANLDLVLRDAADAVAAFRAEGRTVLLHCVAAQSRTPTVAAIYAARHLGMDPQEALRDVQAALPAACPNPDFQAAINRSQP